MVGRHLTAVNRIDLAHALFDEGMPGLTQHRLAAPNPGNVLSVPSQARVVNDPLRPQLRQESFGQQSHYVVTLDEMAGVVEEETAIKIAIPGNAKIRLLGDHAIRCGSAVLDQ